MRDKKQLAELVKSEVCYQGELFFNTKNPDGTMRKLTNPSKLNKLGWRHKIEVEDGIDKMYDWYSTSLAKFREKNE
jgi:GDP-L-fucose synthase